MTELLPPIQAERVRKSLRDYLTTTFALSDPAVSEGLDEFLSSPDTGMFKGPYARLRLPYRPAGEGWRTALEWYEGFPPYGHQEAAFRRLSSSVNGQSRRPLPTLVTTGTGSGKTESFLYPILDHVRRTRRDGIGGGIKALILYPMNALANDQAARLARILTDHAADLNGATAALFTGQDGPQRTVVSADGLITDRAVIRDSPPDILLTNYKMLDQLLLRDADQKLWKASAATLQYLVLDEFHTYDGAQGTDVAMLLRRLGLALKSHWAADDPSITEADRQRSLGRVTPVATSATLGDGGEPTAMLDFAATVFGETFDAESVVGETRMSIDEWVGTGEKVVDDLGIVPLFLKDVSPKALNEDVASLGTDPDGDDLGRMVFGALYQGALPADLEPNIWLALSQALPLVRSLISAAPQAVSLTDLVRAVIPVELSVTLAAKGVDREWEQALAHVISALGHVRAVAGRAALSTDVHLWVRELSRVDRVADTTARFLWSDDGATTVTDIDDIRPAFPAVFCRECGRSGWGITLAPVGADLLGAEPNDIRRGHATRQDRFRALIHAPTEGEQALAGEPPAEGLSWLSLSSHQLVGTPSAENPELRAGRLLPVLTVTGPEADERSKSDECPSCSQPDSIRFLGSAIATLLSVTLSTLFGSGALDAQEKKALVFTDSVQDAAHRAGFVQARSHTLTLRAVWREALAEGALNLQDLVDEVVRRAGDDPLSRYRILAPDSADRDSFTPFWTEASLRQVPAPVRNRVKKRLALDAMLEFGLSNRLGRTLELTGSAAAGVNYGTADKMAGIARAVLDATETQTSLSSGPPTAIDLTRWVRGVLERMRMQGAIDHPWFEKYRLQDGNRWSIWVGRPRNDGMPAFPKRRPAPAYPRLGGPQHSATEGLDAVTSPQSWYARWTARVLGFPPADGGRLARLLLERLSGDGFLTSTQSDSSASVLALRPSDVLVVPTSDADLRAGRHLLRCTTCHSQYPGSRDVVDQLDKGPCLVIRCPGDLERAVIEPGFYRNLYASPDMRRIVAREHTSLLEDKVRREYEDSFRSSSSDPQAPNVLVATPTLEMGIDIGDLSTVMLASLPKTVASYLQRVGRAGRLTGNALDLAYVTGRGDQLPKLGDPLSVINGEVRPPATYVQAEEILQRQLTASVVDGFARDPGRSQPKTAAAAMGSTAPGSFLGDVIDALEGSDVAVETFLATFDLPEPVDTGLREWVQAPHGPGTSNFAAAVYRAGQRWRATVEELQHKKAKVEQLLPELEHKLTTPSVTEDDRKALRSAKSNLALLSGQLGRQQGKYWVSVLEEYGLLPNYTLLDDSVRLDVGVSWVDPDTGSFATEPATFARGAANAIREFAPGSWFYARGWEIRIDAVDLGLNGAAIRPWSLCGTCGYARDVNLDGPVTSCPRCGDTAIGDVDQRFDVVELTRASAEVQRDEAAIGDRHDDRQRTTFQVVPTADIDPAHIRRRWYAQTGIGATYLAPLDVRWTNTGTRIGGADRLISGEQVNGSQFRVCEGCGKIDIEQGRNHAYEHRPWCRYRTAATETNRTVVLSRTLRTQGLLIRLPFSVTTGDDFAIPSFRAAVLLGLREQLGGHPDHLQAETVIEPDREHGAHHQALLLHDTVPGGTGYLAELADPESLRTLLETAWRIVRDCECRVEDRLACHRCLLPFVSSATVRRVSRASAERHLGALLGINPELFGQDDSNLGEWDVSEKPIDGDEESFLEQSFRKVLKDRLAAVSATVQELPGPTGNTIVFTLPGGTRQWTLTPQQQMMNSKPDFVLASNDTTVPSVAIFTDGRRFHATPAHNRLADDAAKRENLRLAGYLVLGISQADLVAAPNGQPGDLPWFNGGSAATLMQQPPFAAPPAAYALVGRGPLEWIMNWITQPDPQSATIVGRGMPFLIAGGKSVTAPEDMAPGQIAAAVLQDGKPPSGPVTVSVVQRGKLCLVVKMQDSTFHGALVLDDRASQLDDAHATAWREWLQISNVLGPRDWPTEISTLTRVLDAPAVGGASGPDQAPEAWGQAFADAASDAERELLSQFVAAGLPSPPSVGFEADNGIPIDFAWPQARIAVFVNAPEVEDRGDLEKSGWQIVINDAAATLAALDNVKESH